jgi:hypothetical protein
MQFHKAVYMGGQSIDAIIDRRESLVHLFSEVAKLKMDVGKSSIYARKASVHLPKSCIHLPKAGPDKPFQRRESVADGQRLSFGILLRHTAPLSCPNVIRKSR